MSTFKTFLSKAPIAKLQVERSELLGNLYRLQKFIEEVDQTIQNNFEYLDKYIINYGEKDPNVILLQDQMERDEKYLELLEAQAYDMEHYAAILYDRIKLLESL